MLGLATIAWLRTSGLIFLSVNSDSMRPNYCSGDLIVARTKQHAGALPTLGEVIVHGGPEGNLLVKRFAGLPGDRMTFSPNHLFRNGVSALSWPVCAGAVTEGSSDFALTVPADAVFVAGDNLPVSEDSRSFGAVPTSAVAGVVVARFPLSRCACRDDRVRAGQDD